MNTFDARLCGLLLIAALAGGCAAFDHKAVLDDTGPLQTSLQDHFTVAVVAVDGVPRGAAGPLEVTPGRHDITFEARPGAGTPLPATKTLSMAIIPCTNYRLAARPAPGSNQDWNVVVEQSYATDDCSSRGGGYASVGSSGPSGPVTSFRN